MRFAILELLLKMMMGAIVFGDNDQTAGIFVEPVHDAGSLLIAYTFKIGGMGQHGIDQRAAGVAGRWMHDHAGRFVNHDHIVIFVNDGKGNGFGYEAALRGRRDSDSNLIAAGKFVTRFANRNVIDGDKAIVNEALEMDARKVRERGGKVTVNPVAA